MKHCPVSVIVPTFNRSLLLSRAINSVLSQTLKCAELIVVDDGSTDDTKDVLAELIPLTDTPIRVFHQENKGPAAARNRGIREAVSPLLAFLDSDDHWHKRKLELQFNCMSRSPDYHISHTYERWLRRGRHLNQKKKHIPRHGDIFHHCLELCAVGMSTVMLKKQLFDIVGIFDESLRCCEDYEMWLRTSCRYPFLLVDKPLTIKEGGREDQVSTQFRQGMDEFRIYSLSKLLDSHSLGCSQQLLALKELRKKITIYANGCLKHGKFEIGQAYLKKIDFYEKMTLDKFPELEEMM